jgi:acetylglutamate kinase
VNVDLLRRARSRRRIAGRTSRRTSALAVRRRGPPTVVAGAGDTPIDFGLVGDVTGVNEELFQLLVQAGYIPVVACLGADASGAVYNINADAVASQVARTLSAAALALVTEVGAVLADPADPSSRIARLSQGPTGPSARRVRGGMIPKLTGSRARAGVRRSSSSARSRRAISRGLSRAQVQPERC